MNTTLAHSVRGVFALLAVSFFVSPVMAGNPSFAKSARPIPTAVLKKYDLNNDGQIDEKEMAAWRADAKAAAEKQKADRRAEIEKRKADARNAAAAPTPTPTPTPTPAPAAGADAK